MGCAATVVELATIDNIAKIGDAERVGYPGGKGNCYQHIINVLPPHSTYIETHLGGGAVLLHKKPAKTSIGIDRNPAVIAYWRRSFPHLADYIVGDATDFLTLKQFTGHEVIYCDPPYLASTRRRKRVYVYDYTEEDHLRLLETIRKLHCHVVLSGYPSQLYDERLRGWNTRSFPTKTHNGVRCEVLWFNFDPPPRLHDPRYIGHNFRERETVKRRIDRLQRRIAGLSVQEKYRLSEWLGVHCAETDIG